MGARAPHAPHACDPADTALAPRRPTALPAREQREPANADLLASYAVYLWEHGDAEAASTLFDAAAALEPGNLDVLASRAYFAMVTKQ